jgi:methionyl-tRNA synthetase
MQAQGIRPIEICDRYAGSFQDLNRHLRVSNDFYIRTTMPHHHAYVAPGGLHS